MTAEGFRDVLEGIKQSDTTARLPNYDLTFEEDSRGDFLYGSVSHISTLFSLAMQREDMTFAAVETARSREEYDLYVEIVEADSKHAGSARRTLYEI